MLGRPVRFAGSESLPAAATPDRTAAAAKLARAGADEPRLVASEPRGRAQAAAELDQLARAMVEMLHLVRGGQVCARHG
jgi:hypothetical protein